MKNIIIFISISLLFFSCNITGNHTVGNGNVITEKRKIPDFLKVKSSGSIDIDIRPSDSYSVEVQNDENLLEYVVTEVNNGVLEVKYKSGSYSNDHAKVIISAPSLNEISSSGSADITIQGTLLNSDEISFHLSGSGDVEGSVDAPSIKAFSSGSGDIKLSGKTKNLLCEIRGSGDVKCESLKSESADVSVMGSADVHVFASVRLKVTVSGSGDVYYSGKPQNPEIKIRGSGEVHSL